MLKDQKAEYVLAHMSRVGSKQNAYVIKGVKVCVRAFLSIFQVSTSTLSRWSMGTGMHKGARQISCDSFVA